MLEAVAKSAGRAPQRSGSTSKPGTEPPSPNWARQKSSTKVALKGPMSKNMSVVPLEGKNDSEGTNWAGGRRRDRCGRLDGHDGRWPGTWCGPPHLPVLPSFPPQQLYLAAYLISKLRA